MKTEKEIQTEIIREFGSKDWCRLWRQNSGFAVPLWAYTKKQNNPPRIAFGIPGCADLSGILSDGRRLEIEVKKPKGVWSEKQRNFAYMMNKMNGVYILATSVQDVYDQLDEIGFEYE